MIGLGLSIAQVAARRRVASAAAFIPPYNQLTIATGDSRNLQSGGLSGTYGSSGLANNIGASNAMGLDSFLGPMVGNKLRQGEYANAGLGDQNVQQIVAYYRPGQTNLTGSISGTTLTITAARAGSAGTLGVGSGITGPNIAPGTTITAVLTGSGTTGTYTVSPSQTAASGDVDNVDVARGIETIAANPAANVVLYMGTNSSNSAANLATALAAYDTAIKGLTDPTFNYPVKGSPLALYQGRPKNLIIFNETPRGITATGASFGAAGDPVAFKAYADELKKYDYASGDAKANPRVVVVDTFNDPSILDVSSGTAYNPLPGLFADGLHLAPTVTMRAALVASTRLTPLFSSAPTFERLPDTTNLASFLNPNPLLTGSGGTLSVGSTTHTITGAANIPTSTTVLVSGGTASGLTIDIATAAMGGTAGSKVSFTVTGTASAETSVTVYQRGTSTQRNTVDMAADTLRCTARTRFVITSGGDLIEKRPYVTLQATSPANSAKAQAAGRGSAAGYGNNAQYPVRWANGFVTLAHDWLTQITPNVSLVGTGATGVPGTIETGVSFVIPAGTAQNFVVEISQMGSIKVVD